MTYSVGLRPSSFVGNGPSSRFATAVGAAGSLCEESLQAVILAQYRRTQLEDGLGTLGDVPILVASLDPGVELPHQRLHETAGYRQSFLSVTRVVHPRLVVRQIAQRLRHQPPGVLPVQL